METSQVISLVVLVLAVVLTSVALGANEEQDVDVKQHHKRSLDYPALEDENAYDMDKRGGLLRYGKRGGLFRFGKRGTLFRFGKRGTLFRFGRSGPSDEWMPVSDVDKRTFHWGREIQ